MDYQKHRQEATKHGVGNETFRPPQGESKIRVLTEMEPIGTHFFGEGIKPQNCTMDNLTCPHCKRNHDRSVKVICYIVDREDERVKLAELPWSIFSALGDFALSSEYKFKGTPPYDIIIKKEGSGMQTKYRITPGKNEKAITKEQKAALEKKTPLLEIMTKRIKKAQQDNQGDDLEDLESTEEDEIKGIEKTPETGIEEDII